MKGRFLSFKFTATIAQTPSGPQHIRMEWFVPSSIDGRVVWSENPCSVYGLAFETCSSTSTALTKAQCVFNSLIKLDAFMSKYIDVARGNATRRKAGLNWGLERPSCQKHY